MLTSEVANSVGLWLACIPLLVISVIQVILIYSRAKKISSDVTVQLTQQECRLALQTGLITAVGPSITSFISILGLQAVVGSPVALQRSSIICAAGTELRAANFAADAAGTILSLEMPLDIYTAALWVMALNGCGWLVFCLLFTDRMSAVAKRITKGSSAMLGVFATSAILGTCCYNGTMYLRYGGGMVISFLCAVLARLSCGMVATKYPKIKAWSMGISLVCGMAGGAFAEYLQI